MRYSLLDLTQNILSSMDSDEINSITDTTESLQVVQIIKTVYNDIISRGGMASGKTLFNLTASGDSAKPVLMTKPSNITNIEWLRYNGVAFGETDPNWTDLQFYPPDMFITMVQQMSPSDSDVDTMTHTVNGYTFTFNFRTDGSPTQYTSFDDNTLIFNSYDSAVDSTLQSSKMMGYGTRDYVFIEVDSFVPELAPDQFSLLLNEAKSLAWAELKQTPHLKAESTARKNWTHLAKSRRSIITGNFNSGVHARTDGPNFGRI